VCFYPILPLRQVGSFACHGGLARTLGAFIWTDLLSPCLQDNAALEERPSKHLWLGNLNARLPRTILKAWFEAFGPVDDVVTFPGRMYAFVNFRNPEDARAARERLDDQQARLEP
jgi:RNA recognition motif-containing protein